jgi:hypothetical protein
VQGLEWGNYDASYQARGNLISGRGSYFFYGVARTRTRLELDNDLFPDGYRVELIERA